MFVMWEVEDGFVCGRREYEVEVPDEEIDECDTFDEACRLIDDYVREDFEQRVCPNVKTDELKWPESKADWSKLDFWLDRNKGK